MSKYNLRVTIACPEDLLDKANQLALILGESPADDKTFINLYWKDESNTYYSVSSTLAQSTFSNTATSELSIPSHAPNANLEMAIEAQELLQIGNPENPVTANSGTISAIVDVKESSALDHIELMGLTKISEDDEYFSNNIIKGI